MARTQLEPAVLDPADPLSPAFTDAVAVVLDEFLDAQRDTLAAIDPALAPLHAMARDLLAGGKRIRPAGTVWGYVAAAGLPADREFAPLLAAAASLDLLHVSALVHDDVMDGSDLRRGRPAAHRQFERLHAEQGLVGAAETFGRAGAILYGDLLLIWSSELLHRSGLPAAALGRALPLLESMRTEVTAGQYLDILAQSRPLSAHDLSTAIETAERVVEYKSAKYTVQRPCQFGASLGGADERLLDVLARYGSALGRAFQFRDDLLGVFGDERLTGKPAGDDLREGKRTVLIAHTLAAAAPVARGRFTDLFGRSDLDHDQVATLRQIIADSGAQDAVETMINSSHAEALAALTDAPITPEGNQALTTLATLASHRTS
ncbi:polyprenyl synthetase family protein [Microlunatus speluncae]|uniref:polyprenyl synthetase family protein n=1 Tax=Microlunatus speluncae TaxID=2594267 RepID=UPI00126612C4|nr:polyprenyl synthetase family protein [Microlunatus speluncae]